MAEEKDALNQSELSNSILDKMLSEVLSNLPPLVDNKVSLPPNPWESKPEFKRKLLQAHEMIDAIKSGAEVAIVMVDPRDRERTQVFTANMELSEALNRVIIAANKFSRALLKKEQARKFKGNTED